MMMMRFSMIVINYSFEIPRIQIYYSDLTDLSGLLRTPNQSINDRF